MIVPPPAVVAGELVRLQTRRHVVDTNALPAIIRRVRANGYGFVTLRDVTGPR